MAQRIYLGIVAGIFIVSGLFAFIDPQAMGEWLGIAAIDVTGETEIRATYGGLVLGKRTSCPPGNEGFQPSAEDRLSSLPGRSPLGTRASSPRKDPRPPCCNRLRNRPISNSIQSY